MKYGSILVGLLFLINPNICIVDIFPDFIGYALLMKGFRNALPVSPDMGDAVGHFRTLLKISVAKLCCLPILGIISESERTFYLILTLGFSLAETIFSFYAFSELFTSFGFLSVRLNGNAIGRFRWIRIQTFVFILVKAFFTVLPELSNLTTSGGDEIIGSVTEAVTNPFAAYRTLLYAVNLFVVLLSGVIFYVTWSRYIARLRRDREFSDALSQAIASDAADQRTVIKSAVGAALTLFCIGCALTSSFITDGMNIIPNFAAGIFFLLSFQQFSAISDSFRGMKPFAWSYSAISLITMLSSFLFARRYYEVCSYRGLASVPEARPWFYVNIALSVLSFAVLITFFIRFLKAMDAFIPAHCGITAEDDFVRLREKVAKERLRLRNLLRFGVFGACLTGVLGVLNYILVFSEDPVIYFSPSYPVTICIWAIILFLYIIWTIFMFYTASEIRDMVYEKYT